MKIIGRFSGESTYQGTIFKVALDGKVLGVIGPDRGAILAMPHE
jgi:hypothetical protein